MPSLRLPTIFESRNEIVSNDRGVSRRLLAIVVERKIEIGDQPNIVLLAIWLFAGVVLELEIRIESDMFADRQLAARIEIRRAPLAILALVEGFGGNIWK